MNFHEFWQYVAGEMQCGWGVFLHGPEFWLGVAIWSVGACFGIILSWAAIALNDRREENNHEPITSALDRAAERSARDDDSGTTDSK